MKRTRVFVLAAWGAVLWAAGSSWGQEAAWWNAAWRYRRAVAAARPLDRRVDAFWVEFYNGGHTRENGEDIRVLAKGGKALPHKVLWHVPGGLTRLAIPFEGGTTTYDIYYGNSEAQASPAEWRLECGLLLETRYYRGPSPQGWQEVKSILDRTSDAVTGRGFVENVFQGHNPFGPSGHCVSIYSGTLMAPRDGEYSFATSSDDASFLLIDGQVVVQWAGWHGAVPLARFRKSVDLKRGEHPFAYYHVAAGDRQVCVAAWRPPGAPENKYEAIPPSAFVRIVQGRPTRYEILGASVAPEFRFESRGEVQTEVGVLVRYAFTDQTSAGAEKKFRRLWDFGDGLKGEGRSVEHVYFRPARRRVTLTLSADEEKHAVTYVIDAAEDWSRQVERKAEDKLSDYLPELRRYRLEDLGAEDLAAAVATYRSERLVDDLVRACRVLVSRAKKLSSLDLEDASKALVEAYGESGRMRAEAIAGLRQLEAAAKDPASKAIIAVNLAGFLARGEALKPAKAEAERALKEYPEMPQMERRRAYIVLGDVAREEGEEKEARPWYDKAEAIRPEERRFEREAVRVGAFTRAIEDFIRQGRPDAAEELLDRLEWEHPTAKLDGYSALLRGRILEEAGRAEEGARALERLVATMPKNQFADDALLLAAQVYMRMKPPRRRDATNALEKLISSYPESGRKGEAEKLLKEVSPGK